MATSDSTTKRCTKCGIEKPATPEYFHRKRGGVLGLHSQCKACLNEYKSKHAALPKSKLTRKKHYEENKPIYSDRNAKWREQNADRKRQMDRDYRLQNVDKVKAKKKEYYNLNAKQIIQYVADWKRDNPERVRISNKKSRDATRDKRREYDRNRDALERNAEGTHTEADIKLQWQSQKGLCWWCGCKLDPDNFHVDHRIALTKGGTNWPNNLCCSCPTCNLSKGNKMPYEWKGRLL